MFVRQLSGSEAERWKREIASLRVPGLRRESCGLDIERVFVLTCATDAVGVASAAHFVDHARVRGGRSPRWTLSQIHWPLHILECSLTNFILM